MLGPDPVLTHDLQGRILSLSRAARELLGYGRSTRAGPTLHDLLAPEFRDHLPAYLARVVQEGTASGLVGVVTRAGERRTLQFRSTRRDLPAGPVVRVVARDATEQERVKAEHRARVQQQAAVASLGQRALAGADLAVLLDEAAVDLARTLEVDYTKVLELLPDGKALLLRAGVGWQPGLVGSATVGAGADSQAGYTLLSSQPVIVEDLRTETRFHGPPLLHAHGVVSGISVVIPGRDRPFGVLGAHTVDPRTFSPEDVHFLQAVANVLAGAVERHRTENDLRFLDEANSVLASSLDLEATLQGVARLAVPRLADWCVVTVTDEQGVVRPVAAAHVDSTDEPLIRDLFRRYPPNPNAPAGPGPAVRTGRAVVFAEPSASWLQSPAVGAPRFDLYPALTPRSLMFAPLVARGRSLGTLTFASTDSGRRFGPVDLALAEDLARRAALAVDNARLYREAREAIAGEQSARAEEEAAGHRLQALLEAAKLLGGSLDLEPVLTNVVEVARRFFQADGAAIYRQTESGDYVCLASLGLSAQYVDTICRHFAATPVAARAIATRSAVVIEDVAATSSPELVVARAIADEGISTVLAVPLVRQDQLIGALSVYHYRPHHYAAEEIEVAEALADQASIAIDHARLYAEAGKVEALRELDRLKSELVATISHELRTPLSLIYGYAELLLYRDLVGPEARAMVQEIYRGAEQLGQLVDDVIDTGAIERGVLKLDFEDVDLGVLIAEAVASAKVTATHALSMDLPDRSLVVRGDPGRLRQVVVNLLSNATRYSPKRKTVAVQVKNDGEEVVVSIADQGLGLAPDQIERVFERFYRARSHVMHEQPGIGLGLPICRYIVEAHGGRIWAESPGLGRGSTFRFALPLVESPEQTRRGEKCSRQPTT